MFLLIVIFLYGGVETKKDCFLDVSYVFDKTLVCDEIWDVKEENGLWKDGRRKHLNGDYTDKIWDVEGETRGEEFWGYFFIAKKVWASLKTDFHTGRVFLSLL